MKNFSFVLTFAVLFASIIDCYDICLPVFKDDKNGNNITRKDYEMRMLLAKYEEALRSPKKKNTVNQVELQGTDCADHHHLCWHWALACECDRNPGFMHETCALSCGICGSCQDTMTWCDQVVQTDYRYCYSQPMFALNMCRKTCHMCRGDCYDHHVRCQEWARRGACDKSPHYMYRYCMKSCRACD